MQIGLFQFVIEAQNQKRDGVNIMNINYFITLKWPNFRPTTFPQKPFTTEYRIPVDQASFHTFP